MITNIDGTNMGLALLYLDQRGSERVSNLLPVMSTILGYTRMQKAMVQIGVIHVAICEHV